jgi:hypothetical protein
MSQGEETNEIEKKEITFHHGLDASSAAQDGKTGGQ